MEEEDMRLSDFRWPRGVRTQERDVDWYLKTLEKLRNNQPKEEDMTPPADRPAKKPKIDKSELSGHGAATVIKDKIAVMRRKSDELLKLNESLAEFAAARNERKPLRVAVYGYDVEVMVDDPNTIYDLIMNYINDKITKVHAEIKEAASNI